MRFRSALLMGLVLLLLPVLAATVGTVAWVLGQSARAKMAEDLARSGLVFEDLQAYRRSLIQSQSRVIAEEPRLKAVVAAEDVSHETVAGVAVDVQRASRVDLLLITDATGKLRVDVADLAAVGYDLSGKPLIADALKNGESAGVWLREDHAYQMQALRLAFGQKPVGVLVVGMELDARLAETVERQTASGVVIELDGRPIAQSALEGQASVARDALATALARVPPATSTPAETELAGVRYLAVSAPFPGYRADHTLRYVMLRSIDRALAPARKLIRLVLAILGVAVLAALLWAALLARRLSRPVDALVAFTAEVAQGSLEARAPVAGPVEIAGLAEAMNRMVAEIAESRTQLIAKERLEKEMEIATHIQTSLVPRRFEVRNMQLAARMIPADDVGGDYYDVLPTPDGCWIGIGDVAGHGLNAGLVMLMIQSAVSALVKIHKEAPPRQLVAALNELLYENIRERLARDEHVTFSLVRYHEDGRVVFAGAHEDILICRGAGGACERIPTPGTWLGAKRNVASATTDSTIQLRRDDIVVLYTDGVTEAMNANNEQFGIDRLCREVEAAREENVEQIRDRILDAVAKWQVKQEDDVVLLVVRYRPAEGRGPIT
jgi:phosphoserine phosphatase RsbU/P